MRLFLSFAFLFLLVGCGNSGVKYSEWKKGEELCSVNGGLSSVEHYFKDGYILYINAYCNNGAEFRAYKFNEGK